jgi:hypothetical protein
VSAIKRAPVIKIQQQRRKREIIQAFTCLTALTALYSRDLDLYDEGVLAFECFFCIYAFSKWGRSRKTCNREVLRIRRRGYNSASIC